MFPGVRGNCMYNYVSASILTLLVHFVVAVAISNSESVRAFPDVGGNWVSNYVSANSGYTYLIVNRVVYKYLRYVAELNEVNLA